jgi:hypothetical protein
MGLVECERFFAEDFQVRLFALTIQREPCAA